MGFSRVFAVSSASHRSLLWVFLWCAAYLPATPGDHLPPHPLLLSRHPRLLHLLLHHGLPLHSLQPPRLPHPVRPLCGVGHLPAPPSLAHRAGRPPPLLHHHLPPPPLCPLPPASLPLPAACPRPTTGRFCKLGSPLHWGQHSLGSTQKPSSLNFFSTVLNL